MKPSHLVTPRTMNECHWVPGYMSAPQAADRADRIVFWGCALAAAALLMVFIVFPDAR